jgi:hypothetical protein
MELKERTVSLFRIENGIELLALAMKACDLQCRGSCAARSRGEQNSLFHKIFIVTQLHLKFGVFQISADFSFQVTRYDTRRRVVEL